MNTYVLNNTDDFKALTQALYKQLSVEGMMIAYNVITALGYGDYDYLWDHLCSEKIEFDGDTFSQRFIEELTPRLPSDFEQTAQLSLIVERSLQSFVLNKRA